jgi:hypothetical protein
MSRKKQLLRFIPDALSHRVMLVVVLVLVLIFLSKIAL